MKIDSYQQTGASDALSSSRQVTPDKSTGSNATSGPAASGDSVSVSSDAKLLATALKSVEGPSEMRMDLVEKMRAKLDAGELGRDAGAIADRMIDGLLGE